MRLVIFTALFWQLCQGANIVSKGQTVKVMEKGTIELPCVVNDREEDVYVAWYKGDNLLFLNDEDRLTDDNRYSLDRDGNNYILTITGAEPMDTTNFYCGLTEPVVNITYKVIVTSVPFIVMSPEMPVYHVKNGETNIVVKCHGKGNPAPTISWERKDDKTPEGVAVRGSSLTISKAAKEHSGTYACTAQNEVGSVTRSIEIRVYDADAPEEKPWVKTTYGDGFIPAKKGADTEVVCTYNGSPDPQLEWFFNGYKINFQEERFRKAAQTFQREKGYTKAILLLTEINEDMFGDYQCRASNQLGSDQIAVHVSGRPGPPKMELDQSVLSWTVRSYDDVVEYRIHLRLEKQDEWNRIENIRVTKNDKKGADIWVREVDLRQLITPGVKYEIQVKARNGLGWGSFAKDYITIEVPHDEKLRASSGVLCLLSVFFGFFLRYF